MDLLLGQNDDRIITEFWIVELPKRFERKS